MGKQYSGTEIVGKLRQALRLFEQGKSLDEVCSEIQTSKQTYQRWCDMHDTMMMGLERPSDALRQENEKLKKQIEVQAKILRELQEKYQSTQTELHWYKNTLTGAKAPACSTSPTAAGTPQKSPACPPQQADLEEKMKQGQEWAFQQWETMMSHARLASPEAGTSNWLAKLRQSVGSCFGNRALPIGMDLEDDCLTLVQLFHEGPDLSLIHAQKVTGPPGLETDNHDWDLWAGGTMKDVLRAGHFTGRKVALALPVRDTFIDHLTIAPNIKDVTQAVFAQMQKKLPFKATPENTIIRYLPSEGRHVVAFALERTRVDRYLALCECAHLHPDTFTVWPTAMASSYAHLWSKKQNDFVMLVDIALNHTNIVVCREATLYYARTIPIGTHDLESGELIELLSAQLDACRKHMVTLYGQHPVQRAIFFAGSVTDHNTIRKIARQARVTAQIGDPFEALTIPADNTNAVRVERCHSSWSVAFGLGLAGRALTGV